AQASPNNTNYRIALQRAMQAASRQHLEKARQFEQGDQIEAALGEYRQASEYDPSNRTATAKVAELDRTIRERIEASRPKPAIEQLRARARAASDEPVVRTFYLSHADATEMSQILSTIIRLPGIAVQPAIAPNRTTNTLTVRGTSSVVQILEKIIEQNDKPRAEIVVDVEILEVDRSRAKSYGLNLSEYAVGLLFSPEVSPSATT